ncbi:MAG: hypothetical protein ACJA1A_001277 [Saprospiraceae bacterium]|jgi:hypothetical protein|tara:strand:+ start:591 stop:1010 length:420 start_codon:yes stop_codon:yes gene_type:complete
MSENKTKLTPQNVISFINSVEPEKRVKEGLILNDVFEQATGEKAKMWGSGIIGYGTYHYKYESGREGDAPRTGFSPRKSKLSVYIMGNHERYADEFAKLGKYTTGKSCVYVNKLEDIDLQVLGTLIKKSYDYMGNKTWP